MRPILSTTMAFSFFSESKTFFKVVRAHFFCAYLCSPRDPCNSQCHATSCIECALKKKCQRVKGLVPRVLTSPVVYSLKWLGTAWFLFIDHFFHCLSLLWSKNTEKRLTQSFGMRLTQSFEMKTNSHTSNCSSVLLFVEREVLCVRCFKPPTWQNCAVYHCHLSILLFPCKLALIASFLRWFLSFALRILTAHDIRVISTRTWAHAHTKRKRFSSN